VFGGKFVRSVEALFGVAVLAKPDTLVRSFGWASHPPLSIAVVQNFRFEFQTAGPSNIVIASVSEAIHRAVNDEPWIASAYAQGRFGGLPARHSSHRERQRVVARRASQ
jgi:hypothetical protein